MVLHCLVLHGYLLEGSVLLHKCGSILLQRDILLEIHDSFSSRNIRFRTLGGECTCNSCQNFFLSMIIFLTKIVIYPISVGKICGYFLVISAGTLQLSMFSKFTRTFTHL